MDNYSVRPTIALSILGLLLGLGICDAWLLIHSLKQNAIIASITAQQAPQLPSPGEKVPSIEGFSLKDGHPFEVTPGTTPRLALLVFREGCHFCEANWKNWDTMFDSDGTNVNVILITTDKALSQPYQNSHPLLQKKEVVLGVSPTTLASLKLGPTPQTVYIVDGKVKQDWVGILSKRDIKEIISATSRL